MGSSDLEGTGPDPEKKTGEEALAGGKKIFNISKTKNKDVDIREPLPPPRTSYLLKMSRGKKEAGGCGGRGGGGAQARSTKRRRSESPLIAPLLR